MQKLSLKAASPSDRLRPIEPKKTALLSIDMQNAEWSPELVAQSKIPGSPDAHKRSFLDRLDSVVIPNQKRLQAAARAADVEIIYTTIEAYTQNGRDISLDHKISGLFHPKGSWEAKVIEEVGPVGDEIVIPKTASGIFNCTNIEYVLRNLGIEYLVIYGVSTDQCVETAVRDAADRGFLVTQIEDCCAAEEEDRHARSIEAMDGHYCRILSTDDMMAEFGRVAG
ncbi:cysteine hydrolase [Mesorhizobium intechi]|uniref:Cysteine hydrolase n=2 Tax=Mesorhizobium intechi TaxID=537601 RepID=A0A8T9AP67_9HYPH|nr:isochorismatase family cysteine hydrolase [Mesorhizobium intechi]TSE09303.1 cysteine hydrolase [Mesorhizobium intechi]